MGAHSRYSPAQKEKLGNREPPPRPALVSMYRKYRLGLLSSPHVTDTLMHNMGSSRWHGHHVPRPMPHTAAPAQPAAHRSGRRLATTAVSALFFYCSFLPSSSLLGFSSWPSGVGDA